MQKKLSISISKFTVLFWGIFSGCATTAPITKSQDLRSLSDSVAGIIVPVALKSSNIYAEDGCTLSLVRNRELSTFDLEIKRESELIFAEIPPGTYSLKEINCGGKRWDFTFHPAPAFQIFDHAISMISGVGITLGEDQQMTLQFQDRIQNFASAKEILKRLPAGSKGRVVSGYTGKTIPEALLLKSAPSSDIQLFSRNHDQEKASLDQDGLDLNRCLAEEAKINGLLLGNLKLKLTYENHALTKFEVKDGWNTFTSALTECYRTYFQNFKPSISEKFTYSISI